MFEWDAAKAAKTLAERGLDFEDAAQALLGLTLTTESRRGAEPRLKSLAEVEGRVLVIVWTPRAGAIRLISVRRAKRREDEQYRQEVSRRAASRQD